MDGKARMGWQQAVTGGDSEKRNENKGGGRKAMGRPV